VNAGIEASVMDNSVASLTAGDEGGDPLLLCLEKKLVVRMTSGSARGRRNRKRKAEHVYPPGGNLDVTRAIAAATQSRQDNRS
jgi:hypothetical protein